MSHSRRKMARNSRLPATAQAGLTTEGNGSPVEYDFIGTGFHVGGGYIVTNKHVLQPWTEDDLVKDDDARFERSVRASNGLSFIFQITRNHIR